MPDLIYRYGGTGREEHIIAAAAYAAGEVVTRAGYLGVYKGLKTCAIGDKIALAVDGVWEGVAATGDTWTDGSQVEWDNTAKTLVAAAAGDTEAGRAVGAKTSGPVIAHVNLNQGVIPAA